MSNTQQEENTYFKLIDDTDRVFKDKLTKLVSPSDPDYKVANDNLEDHIRYLEEQRIQAQKDYKQLNENEKQYYIKQGLPGDFNPDNVENLQKRASTDEHKEGYNLFVASKKDKIRGDTEFITDENDKKKYFYPENIRGTKGLDITNETNKELIQEQLYRCADLENLYLLKHNELLKMFEFALIIFDRYTYTTELLLYLVKHLEKQDISPPPPIIPPPPPKDCPEPDVIPPIEPNIAPLKIDAPRVIITEMPKLIENQQQIFKTITNLKDTINDIPVLSKDNKNIGADDLALTTRGIKAKRLPDVDNNDWDNNTKPTENSYIVGEGKKFSEHLNGDGDAKNAILYGGSVS